MLTRIVKPIIKAWKAEINLGSNPLADGSLTTAQKTHRATSTLR